MVESIKQDMVMQAMYRNMAEFSVHVRAAEFAKSKDALDSAQNNLLTQMINKQSELTREIGKG